MVYEVENYENNWAGLSINPMNFLTDQLPTGLIIISLILTPQNMG